jgi:hypothetical protein
MDMRSIGGRGYRERSDKNVRTLLLVIGSFLTNRSNEKTKQDEDVDVLFVLN